MPQHLASFYTRHKEVFRTLPSLLHLILFLMVVLAAVLTLNFEIFRVARIGDLLLLFFALVIGIHWYGQKMQDVGYKDAQKQSPKELKL